MDVDTFLKDFISIRKLCNERRFKSEKLEEQISSSAYNRDLPQTLPSVSPLSSSYGKSSGGLYPTLFNSPSNLDGSAITTSKYGFNV